MFLSKLLIELVDIFTIFISSNLINPPVYLQIAWLIKYFANYQFLSSI